LITKVIDFPHRFSLYASFLKKPKLVVWAKIWLNPKNPAGINPALPTLVSMPPKFKREITVLL
jgi:hypothetical protein